MFPCCAFFHMGTLHSTSRATGADSNCAASTDESTVAASAFSTATMRGVAIRQFDSVDGATPTRFDSPIGLCVFTSPSTAEPALLIADRANHRVVAVDAHSARFLFAFGSRGEGPGQFRFPSNVCVAADPSGSRLPLLLVADTHHHRIQ